MKFQANRQWAMMAHSLELPTLARTPMQPYGLLPTVSGGGPRYGALVAGMYWAMLILLVAVYASTLLGSNLPGGSNAQQTLKNLHFSFGVGILGLFCLRLLIQLIDNAPPMPAPLVDWPSKAAKGVQWALFLYLLAMPLVGWLILNASGKPFGFYGLELPRLVAPHKELASTLKDVHALGAILGYWLIGLNIVASLFRQRAPTSGLLPPRALPQLHLNAQNSLQRN